MRSLASLIVVVGTLFVAGSALAEDDAPCGAPFWNNFAQNYVRYCPDWSPSGTIPVRAHFVAPGSNSSVGQMSRTGARTNWYICQFGGATVCVNGFCNNKWALTYADNGNRGWVNQVYFQGGNDYEADKNLPWCD